MSGKGHEKFIDFLHQTEIIWKIALGSGMSWELAKLAGTKHPFLAPITLILCLRDQTTQSLTFTFKRVVGTILGILIVVLGMKLMGAKVSVWELTMLMFLGLAASKIMRFDNVTIREAALSIVLILALQSKSPQYTIDRMRDTVIGAFVALLFILIVLPINHFRKAKKSFKTFADRLANDTQLIGKWLEAENTIFNDTEDIEQKVQSLLKTFAKTVKQIEQSREDLFFNIYAKKQREQLDFYKQNLMKLENGMLHLTNLGKTFKDWSNSGMMTEEDRLEWANYMSQLSLYIREWAGNVLSEDISVPQNRITVKPFDRKNQYRMSVDNDFEKLIKIFHMRSPYQKPSFS